MKKKKKIISNYKSKSLNNSLSMPLITQKKYNLITEKSKLYDYNLYNDLIENSMKQYKVNEEVSFEDKEENKNNIKTSKKFLTKKEIQNIKK